MMAVCGIGRPSGWRNSADTANQSASAPTMAASANARTYPAQPCVCSIQRKTRNTTVATTRNAVAMNFILRNAMRRSRSAGVTSTAATLPRRVLRQTAAIIPGLLDLCRTKLGHQRRTSLMGQLRAFDHVGITVADLDAATAFFVGLGLELEGRTFVEGAFIDTVCGIPDSRTEIVMLRPPGGGTAVELSSFIRPDHEPGTPTAMANTLGLRSVAFEVDDLRAAVDRLPAGGDRPRWGVGPHP